MKKQIEPLYRKVNTRTHGVRHGIGGEARWHRNGKAAVEEGMRGSMHPGLRHGLDYTPLFRFLLSRVGQDWTRTRREAAARLDREEPIFWMVALRREEGLAVFRTGESSYFSGLYVDEQNRLALVDPAMDETVMEPSCGCCTHTLNGRRLTRRYRPD
ncbi:hypothetical protein [Pseudogemmobacter sonorensis]|uniref:hypothetical protein n=1 Tax=Pseudogemmobacter sonorensis TaxID=2989681 RepID=UPI003692BE67